MQDLQSEIQNLKIEVKALKEKQKIHQDIIDILNKNHDESSTSDNDSKKINQNDEEFLGLINMLKIQKFFLSILKSESKILS